MIKLTIKSKDNYSNYVLEGNNETYDVNINFMDVELPSVGDYFYIPEKVLKEKVSLNYGIIENSNNIDEEELMVIVKNNNKIYLQRFYGQFRLLITNKDNADAGYKVDLQKMADFQNKLMPDANKVNLLSTLISVYNIMNVCKNIINYNNVRPMLLDQLNAMGVLEEMTVFEKEEYSKKPTALNALIIPLKTEARLANALKLTKIDYNGTNKLLYNYISFNKKNIK